MTVVVAVMGIMSLLGVALAVERFENRRTMRRNQRRIAGARIARLRRKLRTM